MSSPAAPMTPPGTLQAAADALRAAEATRLPIAPLTAAYLELTVADAYAIQRINTEKRLATGGRIIGHKIGLTATAMREVLGVDEPDYGVMLADTQLESGAAVALGELIAPRAEPEIAFVLGADLDGGEVTSEEVLAATAYVVPAIEIIDSRIADWKIGLIDTIADNASYGRLVLGDRQTDPADVNLAAALVTLHVGGRIAGHGSGADVLGHPAKAIAWLANTLAGYGVSLTAGQVILPGSMTAAVPLMPGSTALADFGPLGRVEVGAR